MVDIYDAPPIAFNWRSPPTMSWEFSTAIFVSGDGHETRSSVREFPRTTISFETLTPKDFARGWRGRLAQALGRVVLFPDLSRRFPCTVTAVDEVAGALDDHRLSVGRSVFVMRGRKTDLAVIAESDKTSIVFEAALPVTVGETVFLAAALPGRLSETLQVRYETAGVAIADVTIESLPDPFRVQDVVGWSPAAWYRDRPVVLWRPNWRETIKETWSRPTFKFDVGYGVSWQHPRTDGPTRTASYRLMLRGRDALDEVLEQFSYSRGRQGSFYAPTWVDDLAFTAPAELGQTVLDVRGQDALRIFEGSEVFRSVAIRFGATVHLSGVVDFYEDGEDSTIVLATPIPAGVVGASVASWLLRQRFSTDKLDVEFRSDAVSEVSISTVSLVEDFPCIRIAGFELTIGGDYVTIGSARDIDAHRAVTIGGYDISIGGDFVDEPA